MKDVESKEWCHAGGQLLGYGAPEKIGDIVPCDLCGKSVRIIAHFGNIGFPSYPRHKKQIQPVAQRL